MVKGEIYGANHETLPINGYHAESIVKRIIDHVESIPTEALSSFDQLRIRDIKQSMIIDLMHQDKDAVIKRLKAKLDEIISIIKDL